MYRGVLLGVWLAVLAALAACHPSATAPRPQQGAIFGLVRDRGTGTELAMVDLQLRAEGQAAAKTVKSAEDGTYDFDPVAPGRYVLTAAFAGDLVEIRNIVVIAGRATAVDVPFQLGRLEPLYVDYGDPEDGRVSHYRLRRAAETGVIEGTLSDVATRERVPGAVVTAALGFDVTNNLQVVTDAQGRFRFSDVAPGTYTISAFYTVARRGHIEVQRNSLRVNAGEGLVVPMWIELGAP
jgi:hypothetical protein